MVDIEGMVTFTALRASTPTTVWAPQSWGLKAHPHSPHSWGRVYYVPYMVT